MPLTEQLIAGLDLGKQQDYSVLVVVGRSKLEKPVSKRRYRYAVRWLQAWELGTDYTATREGKPSVIGDVKALFEKPPLRKAPLAVDYTGAGIPVVEQVIAAKVQARLHPVMITSGHTVMTREETKDRSWHVPKVDLIGTLTVLLENELLKWPHPDKAGSLSGMVRRFERELAHFREFITRKKNVTYSAESSQHDDIVLAVALACWLGEHTGTGDPAGIGCPGEAQESAVAGAPAGVFATGRGV